MRSPRRRRRPDLPRRRRRNAPGSSSCSTRCSRFSKSGGPDMAAMIPTEVIEKLATFITSRRDRRLITFGVLGFYAAALLYHFVGGFFGAPAQKEALESIETVAMVVVV